MTKQPLNDFTPAQWVEIQASWNHRCAYCGKRAKGRLEMDHITPFRKGGSHTASNIVPACRSCNAKKQIGPPLKPVQPVLLTVAATKKKAAMPSPKLIILFTDEQFDALKRIKSQEGIPMNEFIRRAVDKAIAQRDTKKKAPSSR